MKSVALFTMITLSACTMSHSSKPVVTAAGLAMATGGALLVASGPRVNDANGDGINQWALDDDYSTPLLGSLLVVAGLVTAIAGIAANEAPEDAAPGYVPPPPVPQHAVAEPLPGLPELPVDAETLTLAKTLRTTALAGNCQAAKLLLDRIAARSARYSRALVDGPALDGCPQLRD